MWDALLGASSEVAGSQDRAQGHGRHMTRFGVRVKAQHCPGSSPGKRLVRGQVVLQELPEVCSTLSQLRFPSISNIPSPVRSSRG